MFSRSWPMEGARRGSFPIRFGFYDTRLCEVYKLCEQVHSIFFMQDFANVPVSLLEVTFSIVEGGGVRCLWYKYKRTGKG
ncbi:hypothetical protein GCM10011571_00810 [Marinithermofilum abyssi]|uniref:Uncharacterized protein n=1 Tax=Marinithermofilum abyssi TaxID=1571185 RepID=A0A8J2Y8G4_9BACL|nr:hypothetical protein GCM10011571_00810 [Marinithermofilum abyssi]